MLVIFENENERRTMCADMCHDFQNQPKIFGRETDKLIDTCYRLMKTAFNHKEYGDENTLLKVLYGIAKRRHVYITWYGKSNSACEPDRFLISGRGHERLGFIQI